MRYATGMQKRHGHKYCARRIYHFKNSVKERKMEYTLLKKEREMSYKLEEAVKLLFNPKTLSISTRFTE